MSTQICIITPACEAEETIGAAVSSVIAQTHEDWRMLIISDDGQDYRRLLATLGIADSRIDFMSTGGVRIGSTTARNMALDTVSAPYVALLDADDRFKPDKLARVVAALGDAPIVTSALDVIGTDGQSRRLVGAGADRILTAGQHKWINFSMDSMVAWDRRECDARYDPGLNNMTDLDFLMKLYRTTPVSAHIGTPVHEYVKRAVSMSNGPGVTERMIAVKTLLLARLGAGHYPMASSDAVEGLSDFLTVSLGAERTFGAALASRPGLIFEDHLEPLLEDHPRRRAISG